ncbi:MAG TPA: fibronectin type III domain-containing protein [Candidatus Thermoplasmatota archaeon]|nr:fibronectin type III domain-containing protein [Candidatus Thermoplasmatota archaeon]
MSRARTVAVTLLVVLSGLLALVPSAPAASIETQGGKLPSPMVGASGAFVDGRMYVFGGRFADGSYSEAISAVDPETGAVSTVTQLPVPLSGEATGGRGRYSGTAAAVGGKIYYFGGSQLVEADINGDGNRERVPKSSRDVIVFDPSTGEARMTRDKLPLGAWGMSSAVANNKIYLFGGFTFDATDLPSTGRHDWILRFDPAASEPLTSADEGKRFHELESPLPYALQDAAAAVIGRRVLVMGGLSDHDNDTNPCPTYTFYNSQSGQAELKQTTVCLTKRMISFDPDAELAVGIAGELPYRAQFISAATVGQKAYIPGALLSDSSSSTSVVEVSFDSRGVPQTRVLTPALPHGSFGQAVATDGHSIFVAGGRTGSDRELTDQVLRIDPGATPPWAPRSATATEIPGGGVRLSWETPSYNGDAPISAYRIYRAQGGGAEARVGETAGLTFDDTTVKPGTEYAWRIVAVNSAGESALGARVTRSSGISTPGAVATFSGFAGNDQVLLRWRAPADTGGSNLTGFRILRNDALLTSLPPDATEYTDTTAQNGETYVYAIRAYNTKGDGALSQAERVTPAPVPAPPTNVVSEAVAAGASSSVRLSWFPSDSVDGYVVYRAARSGFTGSPIANVSGSVTSFVDDEVQRGQTYYYTVVATNDAGRSPPSDETSVSLVRKPGVPTQVLAFGQEGEIRVSWAPPSDTGDAPEGLLRYYVSRSASGGSPSIVKTDLDATLFIDRFVSPGTQYTYRIVTLNPMASDPSEPATASARAIVNKPPVAVLAASPPLVDAGQPVDIDASNSADVDGQIKTYLFDFGDGTDPVTTDKASVSHQYAVNGTYNATVIVTDNRGDTALAFAQVIVGEVIGDAPPDSGINSQQPTARPGSGTPDVPAPGGALALAALASLALLLRRRR